MNIQDIAIRDVKLCQLQRHADSRGAFCEAFRASWFTGQRQWSQWNISRSGANVLRGLHFHRLQTDYWTVTGGHVVVALVDLRPDSASYRHGLCLEMREEDGLSLLIPPGVLHGYRALVDSTVMYLVDREYTGQDEFGVHWADRDLGLPESWYAGASPVLSPRDASAPRLADVLLTNS